MSRVSQRDARSDRDGGGESRDGETDTRTTRMETQREAELERGVELSEKRKRNTRIDIKQAGGSREMSFLSAKCRIFVVVVA